MIQGTRNIRDSSIWVCDQSDGAPIVLCNGGPGCGDYLAPIASMIDDLMRVIRWEPRGCGRSDPNGPFDLMTNLADLDAIRATLGIDQWVVGGHSHGAFVALAYALEYPAHTSGILYISGTGIQNDRSWNDAYHRGKDEGRELQIADDFPLNMEVNRIGNASAREYCRHSQLLRRIASLNAPLIAIQAGGDIRPNWPVEQIVELMPNASLTIIPEADHHIWLTHPAKLRSVLREAISPFTS